ncbi:P-loop containing nucleoside triphosphate hydrolase protein [Boletus edulis BED1]|uniref:P-loop containing nucleoside triphosphate hydrolase protein n=1 Tax=Boletus edulis BED1 TaxID=1328754 RepID=A0AAD4BW81_BOLED|nr:P-loop containing nucleoside triphosphate hydrolase protein [Boletus edulis BED1]
MTSDSSIKAQLSSKVKSMISYPLSFRQATYTTTPGDGSQSSVKQSMGTFRRSSTNLLTGNPEAKSDNGTASAAGDSSLPTQPRSINVVLFGETGVGKSSVINLIARKEVAQVSSDVNGCTMQSTRYDISFDDMNFTIFDTIGLEEPQMGVNGYLKAIEKAYELVARLGAAGGIHLLLFCMRGGRITATTQSNYRLFCECLCSTKVPIALVFTGLEREVEMEDWWLRNKNHIEHYGIKSNGHACITAVQDDTPGEDLKYTESQRKIRELLKILRSPK